MQIVIYINKVNTMLTSEHISHMYLTERYTKCYAIYTRQYKDEDEIGADFYDPNRNAQLLAGIDTNGSIACVELAAIAEALVCTSDKLHKLASTYKAVFYQLVDYIIILNV